MPGADDSRSDVEDGDGPCALVPRSRLQETTHVQENTSDKNSVRLSRGQKLYHMQTCVPGTGHKHIEHHQTSHANRQPAPQNNALGVQRQGVRIKVSHGRRASLEKLEVYHDNSVHVHHNKALSAIDR